MLWYLRMAWRDARQNKFKLLLFASSIILGVAALVSINSFSANLQDEVNQQSKELAGADLKDDVATVVLKPALEDEDAAALRGAIQAALTADPAISRARVIIEQALGRSEAKAKTSQSQQIKPPARAVIAVASGKGGVGKSTCTAALGRSLARDGRRVLIVHSALAGVSNALERLPDEALAGRGEAAVEAVKAVHRAFASKAGLDADAHLADAFDTLAVLNQAGSQNALVEEGGAVVGVLSQSDYSRALTFQRGFRSSLPG